MGTMSVHKCSAILKYADQAYCGRYWRSVSQNRCLKTGWLTNHQPQACWKRFKLIGSITQRRADGGHSPAVSTIWLWVVRYCCSCPGTMWLKPVVCWNASPALMSYSSKQLVKWSEHPFNSLWTAVRVIGRIHLCSVSHTSGCLKRVQATFFDGWGVWVAVLAYTDLTWEFIVFTRGLCRLT